MVLTLLRTIKTYIALIEDNEACASCWHERPVFDYLVVDVRLDGMSGIELSEQLAVSGSMTPLIFLTAHEECEILSQTIRAPFAGFIRKNEPSAAVFAAIDKAIHVGW
jgi:FixJ family two-component response regulator